MRYQARLGASRAFARTAPFKSCSAARCATSADRVLLRECWLLLTNRGAYRASREELTPVRWDWLSAVPLIVAVLWLLVRPAAAYSLPKRDGAPICLPRKVFARFEPWALMGRQGRKRDPVASAMNTYGEFILSKSRRQGDRIGAPAASWCDPAGVSPAQVRVSVRLVASVAWPLATVVAKRTQRLHGVWD